MNRILVSCPVCSGAVHVSELSCSACGTRVSGEFEASRFSRLSDEQVGFLELFLRSRGNISGVGTELGISYPTATKRLDAVLAALGLCDSQEAPPTHVNEQKPDWRESERARIIDMLDRGEITADEATRRMSEL